ncbi:MAG: hypothetical protein HC878_18360 [Leptolyngbyaceae cyanobacterium SL_5_14]|nr:hypothetical protein [Leptolyngbyaceae cyanobacterium SL_5_14]
MAIPLTIIPFASPLAIIPFAQPALATPTIVSAIFTAVGIAAGIAAQQGVALTHQQEMKQRGDFTRIVIDELQKEYPNYNIVISHHGTSEYSGPEVVYADTVLPLGIRGDRNFRVYLSPKENPLGLN